MSPNNMKAIMSRMPDRLHRKLKKIAKDRDWSLSFVIREACREYVIKQEDEEKK